MKQPLGVAVLTYIAGLLLAEVCQLQPAWLLAISLLLALASVAFARARFLLIWPLLFMTGWTNSILHKAIISPNDLRIVITDEAEDIFLRGVLRGTPTRRLSGQDDDRSARTMAELDVTEVKHKARTWQPAHGRVVVLTHGIVTDFYDGNEVELNGVITPPSKPIAAGLFDYQAYLRRQGIYFQVRVYAPEDWLHLSKTPSLPPLSHRFLTWAKATLAIGLPTEDEPLQLLRAMTLGWRTGLPDETYEPFMQSGTMHIFAISGLHIALIAGILVALMRAVRIPRFWCGLAVIPLIWFYTAVTGWQPSAIRSTIMMTLIVGGWALKRPGNLLNSLAAAAFIILLWEPQQLLQAGFQLSFLVVLSIALLLPPLEKLREKVLQTDPLLPPELLPRWQRWLRLPLRLVTASAATSLAAWLGALPLTAYYFHIFSPVTLLANLIVVPLSSLALASALGSLLFGAWLPAVSELFNHSAWFWMKAMMWISTRSSELPWAFRYVTAPHWTVFVAYYVTLLSLLSGWFFQRNRIKWLVLLCAVTASACVWQWRTRVNELTLTVLPLNGGSAVFSDQTGTRNDLLVDCGNSNSVRNITLPFLHSQGVSRLQCLALTHGDIRCVGGKDALCDAMSVDSIATSPVKFRSSTYRRIVADLPNRNQQCLPISSGSLIGRWQTLHPLAGDHFSQADDNAVVFTGEFDHVKILLLSDLGKPGQNALMERQTNLLADIVVSGLPEKGEPLSDALLDRVRPALVIVTDSELPATRRASETLKARLAGHPFKVIFTREAGAVTIEIRASSWTARDARRRLLAKSGNFL